MDPAITGEGDVVVGLSVFDNNDVEHLIEMEFDGEITYHEQDGYPDDPSERTYREARHVEEARHCAKYHVYRERGYDTLPEGENPDRLALTALAIAAMPDDALVAHFGDLFRQMKSHYGGEEPPLAWPEGFDDSRPAIYMTDVYLGLDPADVAAISEAMGDGSVFGVLADVPALTTRGQTRGFGDLDPVATVARDHGLTDDEGRPLPLEEWVEAVSDLHLKWRNHAGNQFEMGEGPDLDREYDARLQVRPFDPDDLAEFRNSLVWNLKCQIRDRFVEYGTSPPEGVRVTGPGDDYWTVVYAKYDFFEDFHVPDTAVDWDVEGWPDRAAGDGGLL